jgi:hypothetical protein
MSTESVRIALETAVQDWATAQNLPLGFTNQRFTPPSSGPYAIAHILPAAILSQDLAGDHRGYIGVLQVSLTVPSGEGTGDLGALADSFAETLHINRRIPQDDLVVQIITVPSPAPPLPFPDRCTIPVSCQYRADIMLAA